MFNFIGKGVRGINLFSFAKEAKKIIKIYFSLNLNFNKQASEF